MEQFNGYKIATTNIRQVERILNAARERIHQVCKEEFHRLLAAEVAEFVDNIALNITDRPNIPILDAASQNLFNKIRFAEMNALPLEYNFASSVQIMPDRDAVYLMFNSLNPNIREAFASTDSIENFAVDLEPNAFGEETPVQSERSKKWMALRKKYEQAPVLMANFSQSLDIDKNLLSGYLQDKKERAAIRARREMQARLFNMYAFGKEVPHYQLMSVLDHTLNKILDEDAEKEIIALEQKLIAILPDITIEMISPSKPETKDGEQIPKPEE